MKIPYIKQNLDLSNRDRERIGSLLHIIAKKHNPFYLTRLLKLLYLIDEKSVQEIGVPVTNFEYRVAEKGPLIVDLWKNLKENNLFDDYIEVTTVEMGEGDDRFKITPISEPKEKLFSDYELQLINNVVRDYKGWKTEDIINYIHNDEKSLWKHIVDTNSVKFNAQKISEYKINFREHIKNDETLSDFFDVYHKLR